MVSYQAGPKPHELLWRCPRIAGYRRWKERCGMNMHACVCWWLKWDSSEPQGVGLLQKLKIATRNGQAAQDVGRMEATFLQGSAIYTRLSGLSSHPESYHPVVHVSNHTAWSQPFDRYSGEQTLPDRRVLPAPKQYTDTVILNHKGGERKKERKKEKRILVEI